jgi:hypothetical protein
MPVQTLIQIRRGTASVWSSANTILSAGEWGYETDTGRYKIGDGLTGWNSLDYAAVTPDSFSGTSGILVTQGTNGSTIGISVSGITSSQITDFESAVSGLVTSISVSTEEIMDIIGTGLVGSSGIGIDYQDASDQIVINVTGINSSQVNDFNSTVSGLLPSVTGGSGISVNFASNIYTVSLSDPTIEVSDITDFVDGVNDRVNDLLTEGSNIQLTYTDNNNNTSSLSISVTGVSLSGHTHILTDITDVTASYTEVNYLDGSTPGTGVAGKAVVLDNDLSITNIGNITTTGNVTVGGNLVVHGSTTTVNSTVVEIGDNIIRVNTSGLTTGGFEVYDGVGYQQLVYNTITERWEFSDNVYTSGNFIGNLNGNADTVTSGVYTYQTGTVTSTMILDGTIADVDINSNANINVQKLASGSTGQVLQVSSTGIIWGGIDGGTP